MLAPKAEPLADFPAPFVATDVSYVDGVTGGNVFVHDARRAPSASPRR